MRGEAPGRGVPTADFARSWEGIVTPLGTARCRSIYGCRAGQGKNDHRPSQSEIASPHGGGGLPEGQAGEGMKSHTVTAEVSLPGIVSAHRERPIPCEFGAGRCLPERG